MEQTNSQTLPKSQKVYKISFWIILFLIVAAGTYYFGINQSKLSNKRGSISPTKTQLSPNPTKTGAANQEVNNQVGQNQENNGIPEVQKPTDEPVPTVKPDVIYKQGNLDIDPNKSADLDTGIITNSNASDIKFLVDGANNVRGIAFSVGIKYYDWGTAEISNGKESCKSVQFITSNPPGGSVVLSDDIKSGENFCYITNEGRYGTFKVLQLIKQAGKVRIYFTTWE